MTDMREQARDILNAHCEYMGGMDAGQAFIRTENALKAVEAALSLMQPEIDRRVAEERAKLLEQLREVARQFHYHGYWDGQAALFPEGEDCQKNFEEYADLLAQFEKENSHD